MGIPQLIVLIQRSTGDHGYGSFDDDFEMKTPFPKRDFSNQANHGFEKEGRYFQTPQEYLNYKKQQKGGDDHVEFDKQLKRVVAELDGSEEEITTVAQLKKAILQLLEKIPS